MRTTKKLLSLFLSLVMVITSCSIGFTAFAADGNKTDSNLNYWNNATEAEEAFDALNDLLGSLIQIDAIKKLLEDNNIVNPVTSQTTLSDVVAGASPLLLNALGGNATKEEFLEARYGTDYTANKDLYDAAFAPLDAVNPKEGDWSFYKLYNFCVSGETSSNAALKKYCKDTKEKLDELLAKCEANLDTSAASDEAIKALSDSYQNANAPTLYTVGAITVSVGEATMTLDSITSEADIKTALKGKDYYYKYYKNIFKAIGMENELDSLAKLYFYHLCPLGKLVLNTYIYIFLMNESGNTLKADRIIPSSTTDITFDNFATLKDDYYNVNYRTVTGNKAWYNQFADDYCGNTTGNNWAGNPTKIKIQFDRGTYKQRAFDSYWTYGIFDKYFVTEDNYNASYETTSENYFTLLKALNDKANLATGDFADADALGAAMLDAMGDKAADYKVGEKGVKIADYFEREFCNSKASGSIDPYDYADYDNLPDSASVAAANAALNATVLPILKMKSPVNIEDIVGKVLDGDVNLESSLTDIWQRLYEEPAVTVFNLLPLIMVLVDNIIPMFFHDDIDDHNLWGNLFGIEYNGNPNEAQPNNAVEASFLAPDAISGLIEGFGGAYNAKLDLMQYTQAEGNTDIGLGALHVDLNKALPAVLHWITGDRAGAVAIVGTYSDVEYYKPVRDENGRYTYDEEGNLIRETTKSVADFNENVPRFTNIYIADQVVASLDSEELVKLIAGLIGGDTATTLQNPGVYEIVDELFTFLRDGVDDYLQDVGYTAAAGTNDKNFIKNSDLPRNEGNDGLNDLKVGLPKLLDKLGKNFMAKYAVDSDWAFNYDGKIATRAVGAGTETYNVHFDNFLGLAANDSNKANAVKILTSVVDLLIGNWINGLLDFLNDVVSDDSNKITTEVPLVYGLLAALGDFGETSVITDAFNGLFQLKRSDAASFTLEQRTAANTIEGESKTNFVGFSITSGFFLISNVRFTKGGESRGLWPFIETIINQNEGKAKYSVNKALHGTAPLLANSKKSKNVSAAGTDYDKLLTKENLNAAKKLVDVLDELLASLLSNTSLNGFDLDSTDNLLSGVVTVFAAYFGAKNTNDLLKLVNNYLYFVVGETSQKPATTGKIGNKPTDDGDVDKNKVYTSANLSNLVIQTYSLLENIIDYFFYNADSGLLNKRDPNMLIADALYGIVSPDAVAMRLTDKYEDTAKILKKDDYHNWNSFKVQITALNYDKKTYNTHDFLKFGFSKGDKEAFYDALGESFNGVAAVLGAALATTITQKGTEKNLYSEVLVPLFTNISTAVGAKGKIMSASDFNKAFKDKKFGTMLVDGILMPFGYIFAELYDAPMSFILNLVKGLGGVLRDSQIIQIVGGLKGTIDLHINGIANILDKDVSNLSPTFAQLVKTKLNELINGAINLNGLPKKYIATALLNQLLGDSLPLNLKLPNINFDRLYAAESPAEVLLLVYAYVVDSLLGADLITSLVNSLDPSVAKILKGLNAAQLLTVIVKAINVFKSPTEVYWSFAEYSKKLKNTFKYPDFVTAKEAREDVDKLDELVENVFPLLNSLGVTDIEGLDTLVRDNLYTNEIITTIAKALYGALTGNDTVTMVLASLQMDVTPKGLAKYLTDKSYGKTFTSAAKTLKKAKSWDKVNKVNWGFTNKTNGAKTGFINGLAASLRPLDDILAVLLCEGKLPLLKRLDIKALVRSLKVNGSTEIFSDKGEQAATLNYKIKGGKFILTVQSYNKTSSDHRTTKSELVIDIDGIVDDLNDTLQSIDLTLGTNGYESAIIPLLEAFMCDGIKTYKQYKKDYKKAKDNLLINILKPIAGLIDDVTNAPFDTLCGILPNVAYFLDSCGLSQAVANLLAPITSQKGLMGVLKKNGLDLDKLIKGITGKNLGAVIADLIGVDVKLNLKLNDLKSFNIQDIVVPLLSKLLKDKLGMTLPNFTWAQIASHGTIKTVKSKAKNDKGKYTTLQVQARKGEVLVAVFRYVAKVLIKNAKALKKLICNIDAIKNNDTLKAIIGSVFDNIAIATPDEIVGALFYLLNGSATDKFFDYRNFKYKDSTFEWGKLDEEFCRKLAPMLDGLIGGLLEGGLTGLVEEKLYTDDLVAKAATGIYGAVEGVKVGDGTLTDLLAQTEIDFSTDNVAKLLTDSNYGQEYPAAANVIRRAGSWKNIKAENLKFGVKDRDSFIHALTAVLRPIFGVLDVLLNDASLNLFNLVSIPGSDGYTSAIVPLLEGLGVYNVKTQYQYREDIFHEYDNILLDILNPLWDKVEDVLAAPLQTVANILPNLALFFANDGLTQVLDNLLTPITALLDALKPIANVNTILKAAGLDVPKLLKDKVGINMTKFDLYDLRGTLGGLIGADKVVPLINSILPKIKIGGSALNLELPDIDWLALASCGEMVFNEPSQVACFGSRMYVKSDEDITLITVLRFLIETINYKGNYDAIVKLIGGIDGMSATVADVVGQVLGMLQGETDAVILDLIDLLQTLAG